MLHVPLETLQSDQVTDQVSDQVKRLLNSLNDSPMSAMELMEALSLSHRPTFLKDYLRPALEADLIETTMPASPQSPTQKYFLTVKGKRICKSR